MSKKRKIILISLAVTLALAVGVGGLVYANYGLGPHEDVGGNKLIGVGEMGTYYYGYWGQYQEWDTQFIITNPNCDRYLTIEWVALIAGEDVYTVGDGSNPYPDSLLLEAEEVIWEGTPDDWGGLVPYELSPHKVWQVSLSELLEYYPGELWLSKYTVEVTWSGARYTGWWWWGYWRSGRPLTGWAKEKCWSDFDWDGGYPSFAISEAPMELFHSRRPFSLPSWYGEW